MQEFPKNSQKIPKEILKNSPKIQGFPKNSQKIPKKSPRFWKYPISYIALRGQKPFRACFFVKSYESNTISQKVCPHYVGKLLSFIMHSFSVKDKSRSGPDTKSGVILSYFWLLLRWNKKTSTATSFGNKNQTVFSLPGPFSQDLKVGCVWNNVYINFALVKKVLVSQHYKRGYSH